METSLFLAKLFGLYVLIMSLVWACGGVVFRERVAECLESASFQVLSGIITVIMGLAIIAGHQVWEASWRGVITVIGYLVLVKGIVLLLWPEHMRRRAALFFDKRVMVVYLLIVAPAGAWLAWIGFTQSVS